MPAGNSTLASEDLDRQADEVVGRARRLLTRPAARCGTDLAGGFLAIAREMNRFTSQPRTVIVVSNMLLVNREEHLDFVHDRLTKAYVRRALRRLRRHELIPDLRGVQLALVGGGVDRSEHVSQARELGLERFWRAYVTATHATLVAWTPQLDSIPPVPAT